MSLTEFHGFRDSIRWRVTSVGVEIEGQGIERTPGPPETVTAVWRRFGPAIDRAALTYRVPCALIMATICTESGGNPLAIRHEPGYRSDEETPSRVSPGLTQTLISTASAAMGRKVDRQWLLNGANSILAGTAYMAQQAPATGLDPPLVAAAYNAGRITYQGGANNRWKLLQYPVGTGRHCTRFVAFFNDAMAMFLAAGIRPAVGLEPLLDPTLRPGSGRLPTVLRKGAKGPRVLAVQRLLRAAGFTVTTVDGVFGDETERLIRGFQSQAGLLVDGEVGPQTLTALKLHRGGRGSGHRSPEAVRPRPQPGATTERLEPSRTLDLADPLMQDGDVPSFKGKDVSFNQRLLAGDRRVARGGFGSFEPGEVDGVWGTMCAAAVRAAKYRLGYPDEHLDAAIGDRLRGYLAGTDRLPSAFADRAARRASGNALRAAVVRVAVWAEQNADRITYRQSRPIDGTGRPFKLPWVTDCSGSVTCYFEWAGAPNPNGGPFNGCGFTGTMVGHLPEIPMGAVQPADLVVWGGGDGKHVAIVVEPGADPVLISHGQDAGPLRVRFSDACRAHPGERVRWLRSLP